MSITVGGQEYSFRIGIRFLQCQTVIILIIKFSFTETPFIVVLNAQIVLHTYFRHQLRPTHQTAVLGQLCVSPYNPRQHHVSPIIVRRQPGREIHLTVRRSVFRAKRKLHLQLFHRIISHRKETRTNGRRHAIAVIRPAQQIMIPVIADIALYPHIQTEYR